MVSSIKWVISTLYANELSLKMKIKERHVFVLVLCVCTAWIIVQVRHIFRHFVYKTASWEKIDRNNCACACFFFFFFVDCLFLFLVIPV